MLRAWFIFILVIGFAGSLVSRVGSGPSHASSDNAVEWANTGYRGTPRERAEERINGGSSVSQDGSVELERSSDGHFYADVKINGAPVHMLIDTGATSIALSRSDASSAGVATSIGMNDVVGEGA